MIKVSNRSCIRRLSLKSLKSSRTRNLIGILAIALTTILFTSLFTIAISINDGIQQNTFRQVGGFSHGGFKNLTEEQFQELKEDPLIKEYGLRRFLGMPTDQPFNKSHVEISYANDNTAHWMYCDPSVGRLPAEGTDEAATDLKVLELLGVEPVLGNEFTMTFYVDGQKTTQTFTLCGWWEYDEAIVANHVMIPESRVNSILAETGKIPADTEDGITGSWNMDVMLDSTLHIESDLEQILQNYGYQSTDSAKEDYIDIGVNWAYTGAQVSDMGMDPMTILGIAAMLLLIIFTGYLIIYNVFQISVTNDIRFYGLLKTIGTTPKQLKRIIRHQAVLLSGVGIPFGLLIGWLIGARLTPVVAARLNGVHQMVSANPVIFVGSTLFALFTMLISCARPGRIAAKVSPIEAVRYTGADRINKKQKKTKKISLIGMAASNLGRKKGKTVITVLSLSLSVVLLTITVTFTNGFDMDKYVSKFVCSDFILADAGYFQVGNLFQSDMALSKDVIDTVNEQGSITGGGRVYGKTTTVQEFITENWYRSIYGRWYEPEQLEKLLEWKEHDAKGLIAENVQLYGMEQFVLDKVRVLEGDISKLYEPGSRYIAAVYTVDDYDNPHWESHWAKVGDKVRLRYVEEVEYYNPETGAVYEDPESIHDDEIYHTRAVEYRDAEYEVAALVTIPHPLSYRYRGEDEFIMNDKTFLQDTGTDHVMYYAFDAAKEAMPAMETFLADYTENRNSSCDYESKAAYQAQFESFRSMFLMLGGVLSFIVGLVGILNFFNAILTSILARKREFAVMQSIGMTGKQLKQMLVYEGLIYAAASLISTFLLVVVFGPVIANILQGMFWFFTYKFTAVPILIVAPGFILLGCVLPLLVYKKVARSTVVERLREAEN